MVPKIYEAHRTNLNALSNSSLDWSMLCPGPMIEAPNGEPTKGLRLSVDQWPVQRPGYTLSLAQRRLGIRLQAESPELTITYEDAADVILSNLDPNGRFSRKRVGVALPVGLRNLKGEPAWTINPGILDSVLHWQGMSGMSLDFSSLLWILFLIMALQPLLMGRWYVRRAQAIRAIEKAHGTRVITMIHRQEKRSLFGFSVSRHIDLEDAQTIIAAIKETPADIPIDLICTHPAASCWPRCRSPARSKHTRPRSPSMFQSMPCLAER